MAKAKRQRKRKSPQKEQRKNPRTSVWTSLQTARHLCPWDFPGKSTGVGAIAFSRLMMEANLDLHRAGWGGREETKSINRGSHWGLRSLLWDRPTLAPPGCTVRLLNKTLSCNLAVTLDYHFKSLLQWDNGGTYTLFWNFQQKVDNFASWFLMQFLFSTTSIIFLQLLIDNAKRLPW